MARPESIDEVTTRSIEIGSFDVGLVSTKSAVLKSFAALIEAVEKVGGTTERPYGSTVRLSLPKTVEQLEDSLRSLQWSWDHAQDLFRKAERGEVLKSYERETVKKWAEGEELWLPDFAEDEESQLAE